MASIVKSSRMRSVLESAIRDPRRLLDSPAACLTALLAVEVVLAPFAMRLRPYAGIGPMGAWATDLTADPEYALRSALIAANMVAAVLAVACLVLVLVRVVRHSATSSELALAAGLALLVFHIGWGLAPYWANGVYQAYMHGGPEVDLDPGALLPATWLGDLWTGPAVVAIIVAVAWGPIVALVAVANIARRRPWLPNVAALACLAVAVALMYGGTWGAWLLD